MRTDSGGNSFDRTAGFGRTMPRTADPPSGVMITGWRSAGRPELTHLIAAASYSAPAISSMFATKP